LAEGEGPRVVAEFSDYAGMLEALRRRVNELALNGERFDEYAGLPRGYLSKLVGAKPIRRLGMVSFSPTLAALGLRCLFVEDEAATKRLRCRVSAAQFELRACRARGNLGQCRQVAGPINPVYWCKLFARAVRK
jgi:hypothetical protein